jgi:hypothetical protein
VMVTLIQTSWRGLQLCIGKSMRDPSLAQSASTRIE